MQGSIAKLFFHMCVLNILPKVMVGLATLYISLGTELCFLQVASTFSPPFFFSKKVTFISLLLICGRCASISISLRDVL